jgi:hypothetical protein
VKASSRLRRRCVQVWLPIEDADRLDRIANGDAAGLIADLVAPMTEEMNDGLVWGLAALAPEDDRYMRSRYGEEADAVLDQLLADAIRRDRKSAASRS